ncbi:protein-L-isoaspartate O-methyltransferase family protein [Sphingomonas oryzagri]
MGYLEEPIARLRALRSAGLAIDDAEVEHPLVDLLARMPAGYSDQRHLLIEQIEASLVASGATIDREQLDRVLAAIARVERELFVAPHIVELSYLPTALGIGHGQTISHPHMVAIMTYAAVRPGVEAVLDVGTGSGYQAAILSLLADRVTSVEIVEELGREAAERLTALGYGNVECLIGDACARDILAGRSFDAIVVAAGGSRVPEVLLEALGVGGRLVMPVGSDREDEQLILVERVSARGFRRLNLGPARFVPLTGLAARDQGGEPDPAPSEYLLGRPITPKRG